MTSDFGDRNKTGPAGTGGGNDPSRPQSAGSERSILPDERAFGQTLDPEPGRRRDTASVASTPRDEVPRKSDRQSAGPALHDDKHRLESAIKRETADAKDAARTAYEGAKQQAEDLSASVKAHVAAEAEAGMDKAGSSLGDFASAIRKASEELGERDQSMAANMMREVASGIEQAATSIQGRSLPELGRSVAGFARRQPTAFLLGATLAGIALGRLARASGGHGGSETRSAGTPLGQGSPAPDGDRPGAAPPSASGQRPPGFGSPSAARAYAPPSSAAVRDDAAAAAGAGLEKQSASSSVSTPLPGDNDHAR
ncbi:hypothetical protein GCM10011390_04710 [Aureimonas endophytica]|uniref:Nutrient deprivation-induced protein n=1 Tax=Aureimonas endophytica TaxID=2027858 RepID=A0A917DZY8_9HYPH|nr:hypothetical protein [Aureimonas endophytica]GGD89016.1 hypothetical protein GCM10011390_04710 [Aureimonas endophytica]